MKFVPLIVLSLLMLSFAPEMSMDRMWSELDELREQENAELAKTSTRELSLPYSYLVQKYTPNYELMPEDGQVVELCYYIIVHSDSNSCDWLVSGTTSDGTLGNPNRNAALQNGLARYALEEYEYMEQLKKCADYRLFGISDQCNDILAMVALGQDMIPHREPTKRERAMYAYFLYYVNGQSN